MNRKHNPMVSLAALLLLAALVVMTCTGCSTTKKDFGDDDEAPKFMTVVDYTASYTVYRHDATGVHYFCRDAGYGKSVCVMVNADGTPYTGEEAQE